MFEKHVCNSWMIDACNVWTRFCSSKRPFQTGPSVSGLCKRSDGTLQNWLQTTPTDWGGQGSLGLAASGGWISSFNERTLTTKCKVDFDIFFKIHPMVFGDRWDIIKQPDGWEPTMNCTSGGIMVNTARCASTQAKVAQKWSFRIGSVEILQASVNSSYLFATLDTFPIFPDHQIPICVEIAHAFWFRAPVAVLPGDIFGFGSLRNDASCHPVAASIIGKLNAKNFMHTFIRIHYIPMIYLRCQVCKKQTLKHSWSLRFQTIFLLPTPPPGLLLPLLLPLLLLL